MPHLIVIDRSLRAFDRRVITSASGAPCCCAPSLFYLATRCDLVYQPLPLPLPVPDTVPARILIPAPYKCYGESCEIDGGRLVRYGDYCYVVDSLTNHQPEPCHDRLEARKYRLDDFDPVPPIARREDINCALPGAWCDTDCLPMAAPGSCCYETSPCGPDGPTPCEPCGCPRYHRWALRVDWEGWSKTRHNETSRTFGCNECDLQAYASTRGVVIGVYECTSEVDYRLLWHTASSRYDCVVGCDSGSYLASECARRRALYDSIPWEQVMAIVGSFGVSPRLIMAIVADMASAPSVNSQFAGIALPEPGVCDLVAEPSPAECMITSIETRIRANCFGGQLTARGWQMLRDDPRCAGVPHPCRLGDGALTIRWSWIPLVRCAGQMLLSQQAPPPWSPTTPTSTMPSGCAGCGGERREEVQ